MPRGRMTIGLYNSYDPVKFAEAHRRALARAAPVALAFDANLATFGFPFERDLRTPQQTAAWVSGTTTIGLGEVPPGARRSGTSPHVRVPEARLSTATRRRRRHHEPSRSEESGRREVPRGPAPRWDVVRAGVRPRPPRPRRSRRRGARPLPLRSHGPRARFGDRDRDRGGPRHHRGAPGFVGLRNPVRRSILK